METVEVLNSMFHNLEPKDVNVISIVSHNTVYLDYKSHRYKVCGDFLSVEEVENQIFVVVNERARILRNLIFKV